jgi:two-component system, OmpR family, response regulator RegX3
MRGAGFETLCAYDLVTAEALVRSQSVSMILLDVHLPDGSGLDLCEKLLSDPALAGLPILFISANDYVTVTFRGFAAGASPNRWRVPKFWRGFVPT